MARKRKASSGPVEAKGPNIDVGESRKRIRDFEDVADSDDEFHINRDKVLLAEDPQVKRRRTQREKEEFLEQSDEEVLGYSDEEEEEDDDGNATAYRASANKGSKQGATSAHSSDESDGQDEEDEEYRWGASKADMYGADAIETEEQALEEEAEARRLQKKQLQNMSAADYGFDESEWQQEVDEDNEGHNEDKDVVTEVLPPLQVSEGMSAGERLKLLKSRYPEFEPLTKALLSIRESRDELVALAEQDFPNARTKLRAASAYLGALTMYFALLTSPAADGADGVTALPASQLRDHPLMDSLVKCREIWTRASKLSTERPVEDSDDDDDEEEEVEVDDPVAVVEVSKKEPQKSRAQRHADALREVEGKRRAERLKQTEAGLADLDNLLLPSTGKNKSKRNKQADEDSDLNEEAGLTSREAAEKATRKKSLRFYTSQIAQKANKRGAAGRGAGGDDDIPHRERLRDRQARLNAEAEKRGQRGDAAGAELGGESDEEDVRRAKEVRDDEDDYYDMIASRTAKKKADSAAFAAAKREAAASGGRVIEEATVGEDGKRKITYAIEKNKGLTPHRKKENRNPRVKKRMRYEQKQKKLGSMKPVYKGGEGRGGYGGELTGIKSGLVKSTKL